MEILFIPIYIMFCIGVGLATVSLGKDAGEKNILTLFMAFIVSVTFAPLFFTYAVMIKRN